MKKRGRVGKLIRIALKAIGITVVITGMLTAMLYLPPVQRILVEKVGEEVKRASGYDVGIGSVGLAFPLKLRVSDFRISKEDNTYLQGERIDADISLLPLFTGDVEVNYLTIEDTYIHTHDLIPAARIHGKVGFARLVARENNFAELIADIRQLHIQDADINITWHKTTLENKKKTPQWVIDLRSLAIKDSRIAFSIPSDTLTATAYIGKLQLNKCHADIPANSFSIEKFVLGGSGVKYSKGTGRAEEAPLQHVELKNINMKAGNLSYNNSSASADIMQLALEQPGGFYITDANARFTSDTDTLQLHRLEINSRNGSRIYGEFTVPRQTLFIPINESFTAKFAVALDKRDLARSITPQAYKKLRCFSNDMLNAEISMSGNIHNIGVDTITVLFPGVGRINAGGHIRNIINKEKRKGSLAFNGHIDDIARLVGNSKRNDSIDCSAAFDGKISYNGEDLDAALAVEGACGHANAQGKYNVTDTTYNANIDIERLALAGILPDIPLNFLTMRLDAKGKGIDLFNKRSGYEIEAGIDTLNYNGYKFRALHAKATQADGISQINVSGNDKSLSFDIAATTTLTPGNVENHTTIELALADLKELGITDAELKASTNIDITATTDLKKSHSLKLAGEDTRIHTKEKHFTPEKLQLEFDTSPKATGIKVSNGDLDITGKMNCGYNELYASLDKIAVTYNRMFEGSRLYYLHDFEKMLPQISLQVACGKNNILHNYLAFKGIETEDLEFTIDISPTKGLNVNGGISKFNNSHLKFDSLKIGTVQNEKRLDYAIGIENLGVGMLKEANSYNVTLDGYIANDTATAVLALRDNIKALDSRMGATVHMTPQMAGIEFDREALIFGVPFFFDKENYINIGKGMTLDADITLKNSNGAGVKFHTTPDAAARHNAALDIFNVKLSEVSDALPGVPHIAGRLQAYINYRSTDSGNTFACKAKVDSLAYEESIIGNEKIEVTYSSNGKENIDIALTHNGNKVAQAGSSYSSSTKEFSNGKISLTRFPLAMTKAIAGKKSVAADGYMNCDIVFSGTLQEFKSNGFVNLDSAYAFIPMLGATLHPSEENIIIENSVVKFQDYHILDKANSPFVINGTADITNLANPFLNLRLNATNYEVLNTPQQKDKSIYGKMYVDLRSRTRGTLNDLRTSGEITVLSSSDFAYVLPETAFETEKELDGLVEFVNFSDTASIAPTKQPGIDLGDLRVNYNIIINEGAKLALDFDNTRENYIAFDGDGNLNATYDDSGLSVTGIYKLNSGQLKLTLPIIPLKTFYIQEGGRLTWTGDLYNPTLDITALEKTTVSVEFEDNSIQPVTFNAGVILSNTVNNLGIDFTMSSPENSIIQEQLNQLDEETLSKYAVAMIITGTYLGGRQGVTATSALSSFLDAKINDLSGTAIKNFDVNIGINDGLDAETGYAYKNYSFSFSKRFLNDRVTVVIGGEVNSGDRPDKNAGNSNLINNVSLEWKLNESGNRYIRIFYDKDYRSMLEGEITETGIGYVYKRKLNNLKELFTVKKKEVSRENSTNIDKRGND